MSTDAKLLADYARSGDLKALSTLIVRNSPWMTGLLRGMLPPAEVEDALQDAWLKVIRSAADYQGGGIRAYLGSVARTAAIDRLRKAGKTPLLLQPPEEECDQLKEIADPSPSPDRAFEYAATREDVQRAVKSLPLGPRQVLLLRIEAEMSFREIAAELSVPLGTALTWMRAATRQLKEVLNPQKEMV